MRVHDDFHVLRPATLDDAVALMQRDGARALGGGTDLMPNMRRGLTAETRCLVDLSGVTGFAEVSRSAGGGWRIGAGVTLAALAAHEGLAQQRPAITQAAAAVAGPAHRSAATLGGNLCQDTRCLYYNQSDWWRGALGGCLKRTLDGVPEAPCHVAPQGRRCHAAYQGDLAAALLACRAEVEIVGLEAQRRLPLEALYRDDGAAHLALAAGELVAAVHVGAAEPGERCAFAKERVRGAIDFPIAAVGASLHTDDAGRLAALAIGISGTQSSPQRLQGTEALLGRAVDDALIAALGKLVQHQVAPMRSTLVAAQHRRLVAAALAQRLVRALANRQTGGPAA
jgi:4-hydroxybenzoyl-CoA reductase subunit beta